MAYFAVTTDTLQLFGPTMRVLRPPVHDPPTGLAARRDSRYVAMHVRGAILTWDVGDVLPDVIADGFAGRTGFVSRRLPFR